MVIQQRIRLRMYILSTGFIVSSYAQYVQMTLEVTLMSYQALLTFVSTE